LDSFAQIVARPDPPMCGMTSRMAIPIAPIAPGDPVTALFVLAFPEAALII
jgi:hypothetical protein